MKIQIILYIDEKADREYFIEVESLKEAQEYIWDKFAEKEDPFFRFYEISKNGDIGDQLLSGYWEDIDPDFT